MTGSIAFRSGATLHDMYVATATAVAAAYSDLVVHNQASTVQYLHYLLTLGLLVWATSMFASYAVFGHHRPLGAVAVVGLLLVGNMALTINDQLYYLVVYSLAALFLLIRGHVIEEQSEWLRRRIGDPASISSVYLRGGTVFVSVAVVGALVLTQTAASKPLAGAWDGLSDSLLSVSQAFQRFLPAGGANRSFGVTFGPTAAVQQVWTTDSSLALTVQLSPRDDAAYYWRAVTYDRIDLNGWSMSNTSTVQRAADASLLTGYADSVAPDGRKELSFSVTPADFHGSTILSPATPVKVDERTQLTVVGLDGYFATADRDGGNGPYTRDRARPRGGQRPRPAQRGGPARGRQRLSARGQEPLPGGRRRVVRTVRSGARGQDRGRIAVGHAVRPGRHDRQGAPLERLHLRHGRPRDQLRGDLDGRVLRPVQARLLPVLRRDDGRDAARPRASRPGSPRGSCPVRATGRPGVERIFNSNAHAWVEVYFPGIGWVTFDPTGGGVAQLAPLPSGRPVASGAHASGSGALLTRPPETDPFANEPSGSVVGRTRGGSLGPLVAVGVLLLLMMVGLAFIVWQRGPRSGTSADIAYGTVTRLAARFGFGPRPTQTVYEFTGALGEVLPTSRPELETVAVAKVESTYGQRILAADRLAALRTAQRRLRLSLLRLAFRRKDRPRR